MTRNIALSVSLRMDASHWKNNILDQDLELNICFWTRMRLLGLSGPVRPINDCDDIS